jgi:hypothetical protein
MFTGLFTWITEAVDRHIGWHKLPVPLGLLTLIGLRIRLRERNLHDTSGSTLTSATDQPQPGMEGVHHLTARTADGTFNDLETPKMGSAGTRFGRNAPVADTYPDPEPKILTPNPRVISRDLLARDHFTPATTLNLLAAAWLQFMIRDWLSHGKSEKENPWDIPVPKGDDWPDPSIRILRTRHDPTRSPSEAGTPPTYVNTETHWWDGSQLYGSSQELQMKVRSGIDGKLHIGPDGLPLMDADTLAQPGLWIGLVLLHALFTREHNAICDRLRAEYPEWSDEDLFQHARLVNAALLAKIHTVEWTPAIISHPTTRIAMRANWWGVQEERSHKIFGRLSSSEVISGIPGSVQDNFGVPYALTEEFVAVYKMHPLIPDDFEFRSMIDNTLLQRRTFPEVAGPPVQELLAQVSMSDLLYSFGIANPGAITLHNYPRSLQQFKRPDGFLMDLAATDILRARELGVPRYNAFRQLLHRPPVRRFEDLTDNPAWAEEIRRVYNDDIDRVDLMVGLFAEPKPEGFGFSDTAFRIFILMASRRLNSDRFFTTDYTPRVYTKAGMDWIDDNDMASVLLRHVPSLAPALRNIPNAFMPWTGAAT